MSSWDTTPWNNSVTLTENSWHTWISEISTPLKIAVETHFHVQHGLKTIPVSLRNDGKASRLLLRSSVSLLLGGTVKPRNTYSCILKVTGQVRERQKRVSINTNHSYYQRSSPLASLNWSNNKTRFSLNQPNRKRWSPRLDNVIKHLPHRVFLLWHHH